MKSTPQIITNGKNSNGLIITVILLLITLLLFVWLDLHPHFEKTISGTGNLISLEVKHSENIDEFFIWYHALNGYQYQLEEYKCKALICNDNIKIYRNFEGCTLSFSEAKEGDKCVYLDKKVVYDFKWR